MQRFFTKKFAKVFVSILMIASMLLATACGDSKETATIAPESTPAPTTTVTPEPTMQDILNSLGDIEFTDAKNVILFIGDGMGVNHIPATKAILGGQYNEKLAIEYLPNQGTSVTKCADGEPDSASGGTALATGYKSRRSYLGMDKNKKSVQNVCELAKSLGKKTGVVTNENITDATPAAFTVHVPNRDNKQAVVKQQIENCPDLLMGGGRATYEEIVGNSATYAKKIEQNNVTWVKTWEEVKNFKGEKLIATITDTFFEKADEAEPTLAEMTAKAIELLSDDEDGFFLMVEGGAMDESAHTSNVMETCRQMISFDEAVSLGIKYAAEHTDTIVIVTADHNTGGLLKTEEANKKVEKNKNNVHVQSLLEYEEALQKENPDVILSELPYRFSTIAHTSENVQIFAIGKGTEIFNGKKVQSHEIGQFIGKIISGEDFGDVK